MKMESGEKEFKCAVLCSIFHVFAFLQNRKTLFDESYKTLTVNLKKAHWHGSSDMKICFIKYSSCDMNSACTAVLLASKFTKKLLIVIRTPGISSVMAINCSQASYLHTHSL